LGAEESSFPVPRPNFDSFADDVPPVPPGSGCPEDASEGSIFCSGCQKQVLVNSINKKWHQKKAMEDGAEQQAGEQKFPFSLHLCTPAAG